MKRSFKMIIITIICLTMVAFPMDLGYVYADDAVASGTCGKNVTWTLDEEGLLTISGEGEMGWFDEGTLRPWGTGRPWDTYRDEIKKVMIDNGVTSIGDSAFVGCKNLTEITIPKCLTHIDDCAFSGCTSLKSIAIPEGVSEIRSNAFDGCINLTSITITDGVTSMGEEVFYGCSSLSDVYVTKDSYADTWLQDNGYSEKTKYVYKDGEHYYYEQITKHATCTENGSKTLTCVKCGETRTEDIPASHNLIKVDAKEATEFEEGNIEYWYCDQCGKYFADENGTDEISPNSIVVPKTDPTYAELSWNIDDDGVLIVSGEGRMPDFDKASDAPWYSERANVKKIIVSEGLTTIGSRAFYQCSNVIEVEITSTVKTIGAWAFYGNTSLTDVTIPAGVISLGDSAFRSCTALSKIKFEGNAPTLVNYVFTDTASNLAIHHYENAEGWDAEAWANYNVVADHKIGEFTVISEPSCTEPGTKQGVCEICGENVFGEIPALGHNYVNGYCLRCGEREIISSGRCGLRARYVLYYGGDMVISGTGTMNYNPFSSIKDSIKTVVIEDGLTEIGYSAFKDCGNLISITVPDSVTDILSNAFENCSSLASITIPESVTKIGYSGFSGCSSLTSITIPESMTSIEGSVFKGCSSLTSITIPESITSIGNSAFSGCSSLTSVTIPKSVTSIGEWAFDYCTGLEAVYISDLYSWCEISFLSYVSNPLCYANHLYLNGIEVESLIIPDEITSIKSNAFRNCTSLNSVTLPDCVKTIDACAFYGCSSLANINIPGGVTSIGGNAFQNCESLKTITIPGSVANIEDDTFHNCKSLTNVTIFEGVTSIGNSAFNGCTSLTSIMIPDSVTTIRNFVFTDCVKLTNIYVIQGSYADKWFNRTGQDRRVKYVYESGDHYFYDTLVEATCTVPGQKNSLCVICGEKITEEIPALGHDWGEWTVTKEATTTEEGVETRACKRDPSHTETRAIPKKEPEQPVLDSITRIFGSSRYDTSIKSADALKEQLGLDKFDNVIIACGTNYADALAGSYLSCVKKAPILLVRNRQAEITLVQNYIRANLNQGGTIYLLGGSAVVPDAATAGLSGYNVKRLWGADRYATNVAILEEAGVSGNEIIVASGNGFADSLSASATGKPILLVKNVIQPSQKAYVESLKGKKFYLIGGTGAVNADIEKYFRSLGSVTRLGGATRFDTSVKVAETFFANPNGAVLAYGQDFPDGLCGGSVANAMGGPLLLATTGKAEQAAAYAQSNGIKTGAVLGGPTLISDIAVRYTFQMSASDKIWVK